MSAQRGGMTLSLDLARSVPGISTDYGTGVYGKLGIMIHGADQLTASIGGQFLASHDRSSPKYTTRLIPVLVGYRKAFNTIFLEPQVGIGELGGRMDIRGDYARPSVTAGFAAISVGIMLKQLEVGITHYRVKGISSATAGLWSDRQLYLTTLFLGYRFSLKKLRS